MLSDDTEKVKSPPSRSSSAARLEVERKAQESVNLVTNRMMGEMNSIRLEFLKLKDKMQPFFCLTEVTPNSSDKNAVMKGLADYIFQQPMP